MDTRATNIGNHAYIIPEGTVLASTNSAGREEAPVSPADDDLWTSLGVIDTMDPTPELQEREVMAPAPGLKVDYDRVPTLDRTTFNFTAEETGPLTME